VPESPKFLRIVANGESPEAQAAARARASLKFLELGRELNESPDTKSPAAGERPPTFSIQLTDFGEELRPLDSDSYVVVELPLESNALETTLFDELSGAYSLYGEPGRASFADSVRLSALLQHAIPDVPTPLPMGQAPRVLNVLAAAERRLDKAIAEAQDAIEKAAAAQALVDLDQARKIIVAEATRLLAMKPRTPEVAERLLAHSAPDSKVPLLRGPAVVALATALRELQAARDALAGNASSGGARDSARQATIPPSGVFDFVLPPQDAPVANEVMAEMLLQLASLRFRDFPVLQRIATRSALTTRLEIFEEAPGEQQLFGGDKKAVMEIAAFSDAVYEALRDTYAGNRVFADAIGKEPSLIWKFAPLVERVLDGEAFIGDPIAREAAHARLDAEQAMAGLTKAQLAAGAAELGAGAIGAAPPLLIVLAAAVAVLSVADLIREWRDNRLLSAAANSTLDPTLSPAEEPGYAGFVMAVAFTLFDLKGVRDSVRGARIASAAAAARDNVALVRQ
jgi:hypothetical protein